MVKVVLTLLGGEGVQRLPQGHQVRVRAALGFERSGELVTIKEMLDGHRVLVVGRADEERVVKLSGALLSERLRVGDAVSIGRHTLYFLGTAFGLQMLGLWSIRKITTVKV